MDKFLAVLNNRRVWSVIASGVVFLIPLFKVELSVDPNTLGGMLADVATALGAVISGGLALWSYLKPKKPAE